MNCMPEKDVICTLGKQHPSIAVSLAGHLPGMSASGSQGDGCVGPGYPRTNYIWFEIRR
jgi:hypothetical protein